MTEERYRDIVNSLINIFIDNNGCIQHYQSLWKHFFNSFKKLQEDLCSYKKNTKIATELRNNIWFFPIEVCSGNSESLDPESISSHWEVTE